MNRFIRCMFVWDSKNKKAIPVWELEAQLLGTEYKEEDEELEEITFGSYNEVELKGRGTYLTAIPGFYDLLQKEVVIGEVITVYDDKYSFKAGESVAYEKRGNIIKIKTIKEVIPDPDNYQSYFIKKGEEALYTAGKEVVSREPGTKIPGMKEEDEIVEVRICEPRYTLTDGEVLKGGLYLKKLEL